MVGVSRVPSGRTVSFSSMVRSRRPGLPVIAYGNSGADLIHMRRCEEAVYVNAAPALAARLRAEGIRCVAWSGR